MRKQRQVGVHHPGVLYHVVCGAAPTYLKLPMILAEILVSSDVETPWLDSHPGARFSPAETPSYHNNQRQVGVGRVWAMLILVCGSAPT